jgi:putative hydrolase of the HAD superfamily
MGKIQAIIFDWGGVLIEDPAPGLVKYCAKAMGVDEDKYRYAHGICMDDFESGRVTEQQFWMNMTSRLDVPMPKSNSLWGDAFSAVYIPRPELFRWAAQLRKTGLKTAILSNTERPSVDFFLKQNYDMFNVQVFSCLEGIRKPQMEIYKLTLNRLGVSSGQTLFIDDRPDYIAGAERVGINAILFKNIDQLKKDLSMFSLNMV